VPMMFGIGEAKGLNIVTTVPLQLLGEENADMDQVIDESKQFVANCYGMKEKSSSKNRFAENIFKHTK